MKEGILIGCSPNIFKAAYVPKGAFRPILLRELLANAALLGKHCTSRGIQLHE